MQYLISLINFREIECSNYSFRKVGCSIYNLSEVRYSTVSIIRRRINTIIVFPKLGYVVYNSGQDLLLLYK